MANLKSIELIGTTYWNKEPGREVLSLELEFENAKDGDTKIAIEKIKELLK